jgi:hypothetical protein
MKHPPSSLVGVACEFRSQLNNRCTVASDRCRRKPNKLYGVFNSYGFVRKGL